MGTTFLYLEVELVEDRIPLITWHRFLNIGIGVFFCTALIIPIMAVYFYLYGIKVTDFWDPIKIDLLSPSRLTPKYITFTSDDPSPISNPRNPSIPMPQLLKGLKFYEFNHRPDSKCAESKVLLGLNGIEMPFLAKQGERLYFYQTEPGIFTLSDEPSPFSFTPNLLNDGSLEVAVNASFKDSFDAPLYENSYSYIANKAVFPVKPFEGEAGAIIDLLKEVRVSTPDKLFELYGGEEFETFKGKHRITLRSGGKEKVLFIKENDTISWIDGKAVVNSTDTKRKPLISVSSISNRGCELLVWDEKGFWSEKVLVPYNEISPIPNFEKDLFQKVHKRTSTSAICHVKRRSLILREGDWVLKTKYGWKYLQSPEELRRYLAYGMKGSLFVFDGIKTSGDKSIFYGHLFDENRINALPVEIPLKESRKYISPRKKKKTKSVNIGQLNPG